jgi:hypothetical protein
MTGSAKQSGVCHGAGWIASSLASRLAMDPDLMDYRSGVNLPERVIPPEGRPWPTRTSPALPRRRNLPKFRSTNRLAALRQTPSHSAPLRHSRAARNTFQILRKAGPAPLSQVGPSAKQSSEPPAPLLSAIPSGTIPYSLPMKPMRLHDSSASGFLGYLDRGVFGLCELLGLLFGLPFGDDLYHDKPVTNLHLVYLGIGSLFALGGPMFPLGRGLVSAQPNAD